MRKLYSFIFSCLLCGTVSAQDFSLTVDGQAVENQSTATLVYASEAREKVPGIPALGMEYGLYPEILLTSKVAQDVVVTLRDESKDAGTQFCYAGTCDELYKMNYQSTKTGYLKADKATNMQIHIVHDAAANGPYEVKLLLDAYGTVDGQSYSCTLVLKYDPSATGLDGLSARTTSSCYNLQGQQVSKPRAGIYVRNGRKIVVR